MTQLDLFVPSKASSHRQKKIAEEIKFHLAAALSRGDLPPVRNPSGSGFLNFSLPITVTNLEISPDLRHATVLITSLGGVDNERALLFVRQQRGHLRKILGSKMRLRHTPDFHFRLDVSFEEADRMLKRIAEVVQKDEALAEAGNATLLEAEAGSAALLKTDATGTSLLKAEANHTDLKESNASGTPTLVHESAPEQKMQCPKTDYPETDSV